MKLNHIDLPVTDIAVHAHSSRSISGSGAYSAGMMGSPSSSMRMVSRSHSAPWCKASGHIPTGIHIGFNLDDQDELSRTHGRILAAGVPIVRLLGDLGGALTSIAKLPDQCW